MRLHFHMRIELQKTAAHVATIVALTLLPPFVLLQLQSNHQRFDHAYYELIDTLVGGDLIESLKRISIQEPRSERPGVPLKLIIAEDFPNNDTPARDIGCEPEHLQGNILVSYHCAVIVHGGAIDSASRRETEKLLLTMDVPGKLKDLYGKSGSRPLREGSEEDLIPQVLFTHALVGTPGHEILVIYPATHLGEDYHFQRRPWYRESRSINGVSLSPLYHDYIYKAPTLTLSLASRNVSTPVTYGIDLPVTVPSPIFYVHFLNLLFSAAGALVYWRYYLSSRSRFSLFILLSTALVACFYLLLSLNSFAELLGWPSLDSVQISSAFAFLPSGALLVLAGRSLKGRRAKAEIRQFFIWYSFEFFAASLDLLVQSPFFDSMFSCVSLCVFGFYVFQSRHNYDDARLAVLSPHPAPLSSYMFAAYALLGVAQFARVFLSSDMPAVWQRVAHLTDLGIYREILLDETSSYLVLMYAKAIAIFVTVLYLGAVESARYLRSAAEEWSAPQLDLDQDGRIIRQRHLPASFPSLAKSYFTDLIVDVEDRRELELALREDLPLRSFMCKLGSIFNDRLFRLSLVPSSSENGARVVTFRQVDRSSFLRALDLNVSREVGVLLKEIELAIGDEAVDVSRVRQLVDGRGRLILRRTRSELRAMSEDKDEIGAPKLNSVEAEAMVRDKFAALAPIVPKLEVVFPAEEGVVLPGRLRISRAVFGVVVDCLFAELEEVWRRTFEARVRCEYKFRVGCGAKSSDYVSLVILTDCGKDLLGRFKEAEAERMFGLFGALESESPLGNILVANYLLEIFNGRLSLVEQRDGMLSIGICLRYYLTSEGERNGHSG